jgi:beta-lactamase class A
MRKVLKMLRGDGGGRARHSSPATPRWSPGALAAAGTVLVVFTAVALIRLPHHGSANTQAPAAASTRHAAVTTSPSPSPRAAMYSSPLGAAARSYLATRSGAVLAAVYDVRTGQTWSLGQGKPQAEASIVKLDILETILAQHRADGTALPPHDLSLAQAMIEDSDNDAATSLWDEVGGAPGISSFNASVGLAHTIPSACVDCPGFPWPGWGLTTTTPVDQIALLRELLQPNAQLTGAQREYALRLMENVTESQRWGVTGGVPSRAEVALKNGWLPLTSAADNWQINSIGWVSGNGRNYVMAVLSTGNPTEQYGIDTIDQLSAMVWDQMR